MKLPPYASTSLFPPHAARTCFACSTRGRSRSLVPRPTGRKAGSQALQYEYPAVNLRREEHLTPEYRRLNPQGSWLRLSSRAAS